jgi:autotransporter-associated beta strand protein
MKPKNPRSFVSFIQFQSPAVGLAFAVSSLAVSSVHAATWVGDTSQDWNTAANWDSDPNPPTGNFIINTAADGVFPIVSADSAFTPVDLIIGPAGTTGRLDQNAGTLATGSGNWITMGEGGTGILNVNGGSLTTGDLHMARTGGTGTATVTVGGTLSTTGSVVVADGQNNTATSVGTLSLTSGGTVNAEGDLVVSFAGAATTQGIVNIGAGATFNVASTTKRWVIMNVWDATKGEINVNGGTLNLNANTDIQFSTGSWGPGSSDGASSITLNSGAINGGAYAVINLNNNADRTSISNTLNLNGGTLTIGQIVSGKANGARVVNFNGGILRAAGSTTTFFGANAASTANVLSNGAIIDSNDFDVTIGKALTADTVSTGGGLVKNGAGTLSLAGVNTYTGNTVVNAGNLTLADNGALNFVIGDNGVNNKITGTGAVQLDGDFAIDITAASTTIGHSWTLVDVGTLAETYGSTFTVSGWSKVSAGVWKSPSPTAPFYRFTEATGTLTVIDNNDSDLDGLDDLWEDHHFGNNDGIVQPSDLSPQDGAGQADGDGYDNASEFAANTDPNDAAFSPANTDGDGLDDLWEDQYFGDNDGIVEPTDLAIHNGSGDPDGDLATNLMEFNGGSEPLSGSSWPDTEEGTGDSMNDGWETHFFGTLANTGAADTDGDGYTDLQEHDAHTDPTAATGTRVSPVWSTLTHRWSFTGNLNDSVGTSHATIVEVGANDVTQDATSVTLAGGDKAASDYVKLGSNLLPKNTNPVTIELWAKQNTIRNWSRILDFHSGTAETLFMSWTMGMNDASDRVSFVDGAGNLTIDNANQPYGVTDEHHIVLTLEPLAGFNGNTKVTVYSAPSGSADLGAAKLVGEAAINLVNFVDTLDALGYSPWPDETASATYNEVRIWNGALSGWMREKLHDQGPDNADIPDTENDFLPDAWETQYFNNTTTAVSAVDDNDGDGFSNRDEYIAGTNPALITSTPADLDGDGYSNDDETTAGSDPLNAASIPGDVDGDSLADEWETTNFGGTAAQTGTDDADGDGTNNNTEFRLGLDPNNGTSRFAAVISPTAITWQGRAGVTFKVQASTSLGTWNTVSTQAGVDGTNTFAVTPSGGAEFYRILLVP